MPYNGQYVGKFTCYSPRTELKGTVVSIGGNEAGSDFDIKPDPNYEHMVLPLPYPELETVHLETYSTECSQNPEWDPNNDPPPRVMEKGIVRDLRPGDHVRVEGAWCSDNGFHDDEIQNFPKLEYLRGLLKASYIKTEFHPYFKSSISLLSELPQDVTEETHALYAPRYTQVYPYTWRANVWGGYAKTDDPNNKQVGIVEDAITEVVTARWDVQLPERLPAWSSALPRFFAPNAAVVGWEESVLVNGTALPKEEVRSITVLEDRIRVDAIVHGNDVHGPAQNRSVFKARYSVRWKSRLMIAERLSVGASAVGEVVPFSITVLNYGATDRRIVGYRLAPDSGSYFRLELPPGGVMLGGWDEELLRGEFIPRTEGTFSATLVLDSEPPEEGGNPSQLLLKGTVPVMVLVTEDLPLNQAINFTGNDGPFTLIPPSMTTFTITMASIGILEVRFEFSFSSSTPSFMGLELRLMINDEEVARDRRMRGWFLFDQLVNNVSPGTHRLAFQARSVLLNGPPAPIQLSGRAKLRVTTT